MKRIKDIDEAKAKCRMYPKASRATGMVTFYGDYRPLGGKQESLKTDDERKAMVAFGERLVYWTRRAMGEPTMSKKGYSVGTATRFKDFIALAQRQIKTMMGRSDYHDKDTTRKLGKYCDALDNPMMDEMANDPASILDVEMRMQLENEWEMVTLKRYRAALMPFLRVAKQRLVITAVPDLGQLKMDEQYLEKMAQRVRGWCLSVADAHKLIVAGDELDALPFKHTDPKQAYRGVRPMGVLVEAALSTGLRWSELASRLADDFQFNKDGSGTVRVEGNDYARIKSKSAWRTVPFGPKFGQRMREHLGERTGLAFETPRGGMMKNSRIALQRVYDHAGVARPAKSGWHLLRHTFLSMRLQCLDRGATISPFTVAREAGHHDHQLLEKVYGHIQKDRVRSRDYVSYHPLDHATVTHNRRAASQ